MHPTQRHTTPHLTTPPAHACGAAWRGPHSHCCILPPPSPSSSSSTAPLSSLARPHAPAPLYIFFRAAALHYTAAVNVSSPHLNHCRHCQPTSKPLPPLPALSRPAPSHEWQPSARPAPWQERAFRRPAGWPRAAPRSAGAVTVGCLRWGCCCLACLLPSRLAASCPTQLLESYGVLQGLGGAEVRAHALGHVAGVGGGGGVLPT